MGAGQAAVAYALKAVPRCAVGSHACAQGRAAARFPFALRCNRASRVEQGASEAIVTRMDEKTHKVVSGQWPVASG